MKGSFEGEIARLRQMTMRDLRVRFGEVFGDSTATGNRDYIIRRIAWRLQSLREGDLSKRARRRAEELAGAADLPMGPPRNLEKVAAQGTGRNQRKQPVAGTVLTRTYKGRRIVVSVLQNGFEYEGEIFRSLSGIAKRITGSHWNGPLFFGLQKKRRD